MQLAREQPRRRPIGPVLEVLAVVAAAIASVRWPLYGLIGLVAAGSLARWARGRGWTEPGVAVPGLTLIGAALGLAALGAALLVATPMLERVSERAVEWSQIASVRGNLGVLMTLGLLVAAQVVAGELVFRRWILDRVHGLGATVPVAVVAAAIAEAAVTGGHMGTRLGAAVTGLGFGLLYVGAGRRLAPVIACRMAFELGALVVTWAKWV